MLRRLSDVTLGSIEKILNLNGNNVDVKEKKRKIAERNVSDASEGSDKENKVIMNTYGNVYLLYRMLDRDCKNGAIHRKPFLYFK